MKVIDAITVEAWVKLGDSQGDVTSGIVNKGSDYLMELTTTRIRFYVWDEDGKIYATIPSDAIATGQWYHLVGTFDKNASSKNLKFYINGNLNKQLNAGSKNIRTSTNILEIGTRQVAQWFNGAIDEVAIYNRAKTAEEIKASYDLA